MTWGHPMRLVFPFSERLAPEAIVEPRLRVALRFGTGASAATAIIGLLVLIGWVFDASLLKSVFPGMVAMKVNTAIGLGLAGGALLLRGAPERWRSGSLVCAAVTTAIGILTLIEYVMGWDLRIGQLLIAEPAGAVATAHPGRMSVASALSLVIGGTALLLIDHPMKRWRRAAELLILPVALNALVVEVGYAYDVAPFVSVTPTAMAIHSALAFTTFSLGVLLARPDGGFVGLISADSAGGSTARSLLPLALVPIVFGLLGYTAHHAKLVGEDLSEALVAISNVAVLVWVIWSHARALHRVDLARSQAEGKLQMLNQALESRVAERTTELEKVHQELLLKHNTLRVSENALREREEHLSTTLNSIGDGVIATDVENRVTRMNPVAERLTGWTLAEASSRPVSEILVVVDDGTGAPLANPADQALRTGTVVGMTNGVAIVARDGARRPVAQSAAPIRGASGESRGVVLVFRDISEEKRSREALAKAYSQLEFSAGMATVGTLAAGVGHEINNPLTYIIANLEFMERELAELSKELPADRLGELNETITETLDGASRIRRIVHDLRHYTRTYDEQRGPVDLRRLAEWSITMAWNQIRQRAQLVKELGETPPVLGNESRLSQVLVNLLANAAQAIQQGEAEANQIRVVTGVNARGWSQVEVTDTGGGFDPETQRRLFEPSFTGKGVGAGSGLQGLSICYRIVAGMGGELTVESEPGKGSCFRVALPPLQSSSHSSSDVSVPKREPSATALEVKGGRAGGRGRVLIIDDEPMVSTVFRRSLARDHDVVTCQSAQEALNLLVKDDGFDLIICDLMMPEMTGMDLHDRLVEILPAVTERMVFLTGGAYTSEAREFLGRVPNRRLEKPFDLKILHQLVQERIAQKR